MFCKDCELRLIPDSTAIYPNKTNEESGKISNFLDSWPSQDNMTSDFTEDTSIQKYLFKTESSKTDKWSECNKKSEKERAISKLKHEFKERLKIWQEHTNKRINISEFLGKALYQPSPSDTAQAHKDWRILEILCQYPREIPEIGSGFTLYYAAPEFEDMNVIKVWVMSTLNMNTRRIWPVDYIQRFPNMIEQ